MLKAIYSQGKEKVKEVKHTYTSFPLRPYVFIMVEDGYSMRCGIPDKLRRRPGRALEKTLPNLDFYRTVSYIS
jgi:hypothetical protein